MADREVQSAPWKQLLRIEWRKTVQTSTELLHEVVFPAIISVISVRRDGAACPFVV